MATMFVTKDAGGAARPENMTVVLPSEEVSLKSLKAIGKDAGLDGVVLADVISAIAMHERATGRFFRAAANQSDNKDRRHFYESLAKAYTSRVTALESLLGKLKLPALYVSPSGRMATFLAEALIQAPLLAGSIGKDAIDDLLLDVAFTLTERSLANIHGLALIAAEAKPSSTATALTKSVKQLQQDVAALEKLRLVRAQHLSQAVKVKQP